MLYFQNLRARAATLLRAAGLGAVLGLSALQPALAQGLLDGLSSAAAARIDQPQTLAAEFARRGGQPVRVIVRFAQPQLPDGPQSGTAEHDALLTAGVRQAQDRILGRVLSGPASPAAGQSEDALSIRRLTYSPMIALNATPELLRALAEDPEVVSIQIDSLDAPNLTASLSVIGMPAAIAAGATGAGYTVAILDSGARITHEFLTTRLTLGACYNTTVPGQSTSQCPGGASSSTTLASGDDCLTAVGCGHGTHVAGTAAGFIASPSPGNPAHGVARNASLMSINVFSLFAADFPQCGGSACILAYVSDQIAGLERVYTLRTTVAFAAANMSLGGGATSTACTTDSRRDVIQRLTNANIAVVIAAGNDGLNTQVGFPACIPEAVTVASTTVGDVRSDFSNWGSLVDIAAPGSSIRASYINGTSNTHYASLSGTSMAAPHVAGAFAAIRTVHPNATVAQILTALRDTGTGITSSGTTIPRINVDLAIAALSGASGATTTTALTGPTSSNLGQSVSFTATVNAAAGTPTGTVSFRRNGTQFASGTLNASRQATVSTSSFPAGTHQITAVYLGATGFQGSTSPAITHTVTNPAAPPNDNFVSRTVIPGPGTYAGSNVGATADPGQPVLWGRTDRNTVWWTYTPQASGTLTIDTCGSTFDTVLGAYTGSAVNALTLVQDNDDSSCPSGGFQSRVQFPATAGTPYQIAVAGFGSGGGAGGAITLTVALQATTQNTSTALTGTTSAIVGQTASYTATVTAPWGTPSGTVSFRRGGVQFATGTLNGSGIATASASNFPIGTHQITAAYLGATGFNTSTSSAVTTVISAAPAGPVEFSGGGTVFAFTPECTPAFGTAIQPVRIRYAPSELNRLPSEVSVVWPTGSEHLALWGAMVRSTQFSGGAGRQMWTRFLFYPTRPQIRVVQRQITQPDGSTNLATAQELVLRLRVRNFAAIVGCSVTIAATLRR